MAKLSLTPREFIQKSFSPCVAVMTSLLVDEVCKKNNLSFIELLEPFSVLEKEVSFRDPSGSIIMVRNLRIILSDVHQKPPEPAVARRLLNESVTCDFDNLETTTIKSGNVSVEIPTTVPWFEKWRDTFFEVQFPSDHEFMKHYIACMLVITSKEENPMDSLSDMVQKLQHMLSMSPPKMMPKWFSSSILRYYVLLHDVSTGDKQKAEKVFEEMKLTYNANCCHMLQINSSAEKITDITLLNYWKSLREEDSLEESFADNNATKDVDENTKCLVSPDVLLHPLSPELESQRMFNSSLRNDESDFANNSNRNVTRGIYLTSEDISNIGNLISCFIVTALIPFVETQIIYLNEMVLNKKKSFFSATKRWLGAKPSSSVTVPNAHYYHPDSPELQMRRLGDLCFMFGAYNSAFNAYHSVKGDFRNDGAWLHFAGALEMLALSAFLIGQDVKKAQEYTDESVLSYLNVCRMPQFATRLTLCATECLKHLNLYGEAAARLLLMTCEDSDLRSALLLEEASYCFVKSRKLFMPRKHAFHLVLAGHRFSKANQKKHSLRCYRQAYQVYADKNWSLAEDHIHFTIGKLASALKEKNVTIIEFAKLFEKPSAQLPAQQASFLKEYFLSLTEYQKTDNDSIPLLEIPRVDHSTIKVALNTCEKVGNRTGCILANKIISDDELDHRSWWKLEELIIARCNNGVLPLLFKPTSYTFSNKTNNSTKPICVVGEKIRTSVDLVNILNIPFTLKNIELLWTHSAETSDPVVEKSTLAETETLESVSMDPDSKNNVCLYITPKTAGELHITGIIYTIYLAPTSEGAESLSITGYVTLNPRGMKIISPKDRKEESSYVSDFRLQLVVVQDAPRLKVYFRNLPTEMLCGEVKEISVILENVGKLPISRVFFVSSENSLFAVPSGKNGSDIFTLPCGVIEPGCSSEITIFIRACDTSGRISVDLLFYYDSERSSQQRNLKYRLIYHTMHVLIHESLFSSVTAVRSLVIPGEGDDEYINFKMHVENRNQVYDSHKTTVSLEQISLLSSSWKLMNVISPFETDGSNSINLEQEQSAFLVLRAQRRTGAIQSDIILHSASEKIDPTAGNPFDDLVGSIVEKLVKKEVEEISQNDYHSFSRTAIAINSVLILYWKAVINTNGESISTRGQHHMPVLKLGNKYVSNVDAHSQIEFIPSASSLSAYYSRTFAVNELVSVRMKHAPHVAHSFSSSRICCVPIELFVRNCCDDSIEIKLDGTYRAHNNLSKINESSMFLWLGLVLHTFCLSQHTCIRIPLTACIGSAGTYDLGTQIHVLARKTNSSDVYVSQSSISHSLLSVTNSITGIS